MDQRDADCLAASRRHFLKLGAAAAACSIVLPASALAASVGNMVRKLSFVHLHTNERVSTVYWQNGAYRPAAVRQINELLRDWRTGEVKEIDLNLLDVLWELHQRVQSKKPYEVISGYRSPMTNAMLASASSGVAKKSLHMQGMAVDINLPDKKLKLLRRVAIDMRRGGVGYYPKSGFVHIDTGRARSW